MSFASEVKKELLSLEVDSCCKDAIALGILQGNSEIVLANLKAKLLVKSPLPSVIRYLAPILKKKYNASTQTSFLEKTNINKSRIYCLEILENSKQIIDDYHLFPFDTITLDDPIIQNECCKMAFIRGLFISKGSINDPRKSNYHLELVIKKPELAVIVQQILLDYGIPMTLTTRRNQSMLYIKKSELISEFLAFLGANSGVLQFEDLRIMRDLQNSVNRVMNCDIANSQKSLQYCKEQMEAITFIKEKGIYNKLTFRLQDAIRLREEYPDSTLAELSDYSSNILGKHLSKSGISHCLREIMKIYEAYQNRKKDKLDK